MEKRSPNYLSDEARSQVRELYSGRNDFGLWDYALARKGADRVTGLRRLLTDARLLVTRVALNVLDQVPRQTLSSVDRIVRADAGRIGRYYAV